MALTQDQLLEYLHSWYKEVRAKIEDTANENDNKLSTSIVTLSSGTIALTITFFEKIAGHSTNCSILILKISWIFLTSSILAIIFAYLAAKKGNSKGITILDNWQKKIINNLKKGNFNFPTLTNWYSKSAQILDIIGYFTFFIGIVLVVIFAIISF